MTKAQDPEGAHAQRRAASRRDYPCLAYVKERGTHGQAGAEGVSGLGRLIDVSGRGAGLFVTKALPTGARIVVEIAMDASICLVAEGTVMHVSGAGELFRIGVHFDEPPVVLDVSQRRRGKGEL
jgi:hypothetical protein